MPCDAPPNEVAIDPIITENMYKYLLEKGIKIVYKKVDYLSLDRLIKITLPNNN